MIHHPIGDAFLQLTASDAHDLNVAVNNNAAAWRVAACHRFGVHSALDAEPAVTLLAALPLFLRPHRVCELGGR